MPPRWASPAEVLSLARKQRYLELSYLLERILHQLDGADPKRAFATVKRMIDGAGLDGVDIMVRAQLLLLRRMRRRVEEFVDSYRELGRRTRGPSNARAGRTEPFDDEVKRYRRHFDKMDAEIERLLSDHPHLRRWKG